LQEGLKTNRRHLHLKVNSLLGFNVKWLLKLNADLNYAIFVGNISSRATIIENIILADDYITLGNI
jgi:hypothetical protein